MPRDAVKVQGAEEVSLHPRLLRRAARRPGPARRIAATAAATSRTPPATAAEIEQLYDSVLTTAIRDFCGFPVVRGAYGDVVPEQNLARRAGSWSAAHWKTATGAWLALVFVAIAAGSAVG